LIQHGVDRKKRLENKLDLKELSSAYNQKLLKKLKR